jgi:hypothetical protein
MSPPCTLIVEFDGGGHRLYHVRLVADLALRRGHRVCVLIGDTDTMRRHIDTHLGPLLGRLELIDAPDTTWSTVEQTARRLDADVTVVAEADRFLTSLVRRRGWKGAGLLSLMVMRTNISNSAGRLRWLVASVVKQACMRLVARMPSVQLRVLRSGLWAGRSPWAPARDPVGFVAAAEDINAIRNRWSLDPEHHWYGIIGTVTQNKHADLVASALAGTSDAGSCGLLLAGLVDGPVRDQLPGIRAELESAGAELRVVDELLSDTDLDAAIGAVDTLVLAYSHNGPSGTLGKALAAGTRIVAAGSPAIREDCAAVPDAAEWVDLDVPQLAGALARARLRPRPEPMVIATEEEFAEALLPVVERSQYSDR